MYRIAVIAGGDSGEYEVSLRSGDNIFQQLDKTLFEPYLIHFKGSDWHYKTADGRVFQIDKNDFSLTIEGQKIVFDVALSPFTAPPARTANCRAISR